MNEEDFDSKEALYESQEFEDMKIGLDSDDNVFGLVFLRSCNCSLF